MLFLIILLMTGCSKTQGAAAVPKPEIVEDGKVVMYDKATVESWLSAMTLEDKVGQMVVGFFNGSTLSPELKERIAKYRLGGVIIYDISGNIIDTQQVATLNESLQLYAKTVGVQPLFIGIDQEGGLVNRLQTGVTVFPGNMAIGATGNANYAFQAADITARELKILGINMNFAPVLDVNSNPLNPIIGVRSFGANPVEVARLGAAMLPAYRNNQVICVVKHFPGHGDTSIDSHSDMPRIPHSMDRLRAVELVPFVKSIEAGAPAIMTAHVSVEAVTGNDLPMTLSSKGIGFLRNEMGFRGLIVSDSLTMGAIVNDWGIEEASVMAVEAGVDLLVFGADRGHAPQEQERAIGAVITAVQSGRIPASRIDESVRRILTIKNENGLMSNALPLMDRLSELESKEHMICADNIARESLTWFGQEQPSGFQSLESTIILWPEPETAGALHLAKLIPTTEIINISINERLEPGNKLVEHLKQADRIIIASYDLDRNTEWRDFILSVQKTIGSDKITVVAMRSPYDIQHLPGVVNYLSVYDDGPSSIKALADFIMGFAVPKGVSPVLRQTK